MSTDLKIVNSSALSETERAELDANIDSLIAAHKNNRQEINRLVFESVAAMTAGEDYERQLANKKGLRRFLGGITGSNKKLQDKINSSRAAAQYASQQTLQRLAEQNLMSFDLITAVNNKLNASVIAVENEINQIYGALVTFFKQSRNDMIQLENRVDRLEKNVNLLNWQNAIEYQMFNGVEYADLDDTAKIVCLVRDFYDITKGEWTTSDLLLLKTAMSTIDISPKKRIEYLPLILDIVENATLRSKLLGQDEICEIINPEDVIVLGGVKKGELLQGTESYVVAATQEALSLNGIQKAEKEVFAQLISQYLKITASINPNASVQAYDIMLEILYNLQQVQIEAIGAEEYSINGDLREGEALPENVSISEENSKRLEGIVVEEDIQISNGYDVQDDAIHEMFETVSNCFTSRCQNFTSVFVIETEGYIFFLNYIYLPRLILTYIKKDNNQTFKTNINLNDGHNYPHRSDVLKYGGIPDTILFRTRETPLQLKLFSLPSGEFETLPLELSKYTDVLCCRGNYIVMTETGNDIFLFNVESGELKKIPLPFGAKAYDRNVSATDDTLILWAGCIANSISEAIINIVSLKDGGESKKQIRFSQNDLKNFFNSNEFTLSFQNCVVINKDQIIAFLHLVSDHCNATYSCVLCEISISKGAITRAYNPNIQQSDGFKPHLYKNKLLCFFRVSSNSDNGICSIDLQTFKTTILVDKGVDARLSSFIIGNYFYFSDGNNNMYRINLDNPGPVENIP